MEYQCFSEMMEEMREIHKMIQKLTSQKCHHLTMEQVKLIFFDCSCTNESKGDCPKTSYY